MEIGLLNELLIIFALSMGVLYICHRIHIPSILGFLITGILSGPYGFKLLKNVHEVEILAEIGVILLLFTIGIEFSLKNLMKIKREVLIGGGFQVIFTIIVAYIIGRAFSLSVGVALFYGFLASQSSTAISIKLLQQRAELESPHGRASLAIAIFQDLITVPMMILVPHLTGKMNLFDMQSLVLIIKGLGIVGFVFLAAKYIVPFILYQIARTRMQELFLFSIFGICFGVIWITSQAGLSLALGAFLAGLIISESEYSHQALSNILPFKDIFSSFFFISIGMLLQVFLLFQKPILILGLAAGVLLVKFLIIFFITISLRLPLRNSLIAGLLLSQVGEFSFILAKSGVENNLLQPEIYQVFIAVTLLTMSATPIIIGFYSKFEKFILAMPLPGFIVTGGKRYKELKKENLKDHIIIIGFGINGKNLAQAAKYAGIKYTIIDTNPETVASEQKKGEPIFYGDATQELVLECAGIHSARILVIAINDPTATRRITEVARRNNKVIYMIVRTRFISEIAALHKLGANEVIPEEFETSIEIFTRVLMKYLIAKEDIEKLISEIRAGGYDMFRSLSKKSLTVSDVKVKHPDFEINHIKVKENSFMAGKTIGELNLRKDYGITVLAISRNDEMMSNPGVDTPICVDDLLIILGMPEKIIDASGIFTRKR